MQLFSWKILWWGFHSKWVILKANDELKKKFNFLQILKNFLQNTKDSQLVYEILDGYELLKKNHFKVEEYPKNDMNFENSISSFPIFFIKC